MDDSLLPAFCDAAWKQQLRRRMLAWFARHARKLPWRERGDAYAVWISEIMLQQTQVATVVPYFERFVAAFPTVEHLAAADEEQVLRLWEGLGYYRRARQLHAAAQRVVAEHHGEFPQQVIGLLALPGIGRYTAGAIASIAFDRPAPILEANTLRVYSRLVGYAGDPRSSEGQRLLWEFAEAILPRRRAGTLNQSLMELGSEICTPRQPQCAACPVATLCAARAAGKEEQIPPPAKKTAYEAVREAAVVVERRGKVLVRQCGPGERWAGLWDFPRFAVKSQRGQRLHGELAEGVQRLTGVTVEPGEHLLTIRHGVTRYRITLECYAAEYVEGKNSKQNGNGHAPLKWLAPRKLADLPLSTTGRKIARTLAEPVVG